MPETNETMRHVEGLQAESELKYAAGLYFEEFIAGTYSDLRSDQVDRIKRRYVNDVFKWSPESTWIIARWYFMLRENDND